MTIRVLTAGLQTTIQDLGRTHHQRAAIPVGGAMDRIACRVANVLVGNEPSSAVIEATLIGPALEFSDGALIAICGGDLEARVDEADIPLWRPVRLAPGATLRFRRAMRGCRAYVAVAGGVDIPLVFGSHSTYLRGNFGGLDGRALRAGDTLNAGRPGPISERIADSLKISTGRLTPAHWSAGQMLRPRYASNAVVRVLEGMHAPLLDDASGVSIYAEPFRVSSSSDRMGYRLEGQTLSLREPTELLSEGVTFGTIQLPPGGAPIILMADRQTAGGYPRIGEVATVDLPIVAQLKPGDTVRFRRISIDEAQRLYLEQESDLAQFATGVALRFASGQKR